ncbi:MAG: PRC-barrel domain-containing protein [Gemmatimonadales bacterium]
MTTREQSSTLHRLKDSDLKLADPAADIRGRKVIDVSGEEIGKVDDLLIDDEERKVRFLEVASGGVLGIGETKFLMPVEAVAQITSDEVAINHSRTRVAGAPRYDPNLMERPHLKDIYGYYGYSTPFWIPGYNYPRYPYL